MLNNNGGYDLLYRDAYIVCEYEVDANCLNELNAEACLNQVSFQSTATQAAVYCMVFATSVASSATRRRWQ